MNPRLRLLLASFSLNPGICISLGVALFLLLGAEPIRAQSDHEKHHPKPPDSSTAGGGMGAMAPAPPMAGAGMGSMAPAGKASGMGGMKEGMGEMMGKLPPKELYPTLMQVPLEPEQREVARTLANERIAQGNALLAEGVQKLKMAGQHPGSDDHQEATEQIRRGESLLTSGLEAQKALTQNSDARETALRWFKREMNLLPDGGYPPPHGEGLSWFHYFVMATLVAFAVGVVGLYFQKMRRANALVAKLASATPASLQLPVATGLAPLPTTPLPNLVSPDIAPSKPNSWSGSLLVAEIFDETPSVKTFRLTEPTGGKLPFNYLPGQFVTVTVVPAGVPVKRSYTIASSPTRRDSCEITVKHEEKGTVSHYLHTKLHEGDYVQVTGPSGKFTFTETDADSVVLIGGGVGITPMMSVIRYLTDRSWKKDIFLLYACKNEASVIFREEIEYLRKRYPNLHVLIVLSDADGGFTSPDGAYRVGRLTSELIAEHVPSLATRRIHLCGPAPMMDAVKAMLRELKVPDQQIRVELFPSPPPTPNLLTPADQERMPAAGEGVTPPAGTAVVTFVRSNKTAILTPEKTILEASEEVGVNIDYSCRVGTCGVCKTRLLSGNVSMAVEDALDDDDRAKRVILACQAKATEPVTVDA